MVQREDILRLPKTEIAEIKVYAAQGHVQGQFIQAVITPIEYKIKTLKPSTKLKIQAVADDLAKKISDILDAEAV